MLWLDWHNSLDKPSRIPGPAGAIGGQCPRYELKYARGKSTE